MCVELCTKAVYIKTLQVFSAKHHDTGARIALDTGFCQSIMYDFPSVLSLVNAALELFVVALKLYPQKMIVV